MAGSPRVQLSLKGRLLSEVPFVGPQLRIGRMRENDVVVNNLAVSRFHAVLKREGDGYVLEDLGSENGTLLNGERIQGSVAITPDDAIQLGKYELRLVLQPGADIPSLPKSKASDAWDASQTYLADLPRPAAKGPLPALAGKPAAPPLPEPAAPVAGDPADDFALPTLDAIDLEPETSPAAESGPDPDGAFAFGEDDLPPAEESPAMAPSASAPNLEHTSLFDFSAPVPAPAVAAAAPPAPAPERTADAAATPPLHAGLIVQRDGKLHGICSWEKDELVAGRAPECDVVLGDAGVSRRHATFTRSGERYTLRDLGSVNGVYVNGQRTKECALAVGDVIRIESFELTFVLDHTPIGSEVSGPVAAQPRAQETARATQFSLEAAGSAEADDDLQLEPIASDPNDLATAPAAEASAEPATEAAFEILPPADDAASLAAQGDEPIPAFDLPESDIVSDATFEEDDEKESSAQRTALAQAAPVAARGVRLQLAVDERQLSTRVREALAILAEEGVLLSARISFERE